MNSNNHKEYEIIDSNSSLYPLNRNNDYSRYPYSNNPNQPMPNNNYKDWLDLCQGNIQYGQNPEEFIEVQEAVTKTLSIVGTILGVTFPIAGAAVTILGEVIGLLWPSSADTSQNVWINFINSTEKLIDEKIDNALKITAVHELEGVQTHMYHYQNALRNWKGNPGNLSSRLLVRDEWNKAEGAFTSAMPHFRGTVPKDKVLLLAIYAHAANLHLLLLRDLSIYGTDWGYKEEEIALIYNKQLLLTIQYINYCIQTYNLGWNMVKDRYNSYLPGNKWNMVNTYRRNMTLKVLDIIALFSNYDNHKYPGTKEKSFIAQIIKAELTREVYTDANSDINFNSTFEEQEKDFTRGFNLFTWLEDLTLYTRNYANPPLYPDANFIFTANRNCIMKTNDTRCNMGNIYGNRRENDIATHINLHEMKIDKLVITHHKNYLTVILKIEFYQNTQRVAIYDSQSTTAPNDRATTILQLTNATESSQTNGEIYNHILSYIKTKNIIESTNQRQVACAWTHWSVDYNNTIQEKIITSIPAIKAEFSDDITIIQNPGHIGGELIQFNTGNSSSIQIACLTSNFIGTKNYGVRIRYAANKAIRLNATFIGVGTSSFVTNDTMTSSITEGKYLYQQFGYATIFTRDNPARLAPNRLIRFMINNPSPSLGSDTILVIDRIEIIPLDEFPTLLQDKQEIQRNIQTTTNNVFTDYTKNSLKPETTDYEIDQIANEIETISEEQNPQEKMMLLDEIKHAKQLSYARNLLQNGDFQDLISWTINNDVTVQTKNTVFKEYALQMPGARIIENTVFPTDLYQKIDESKLKSYTRYLVRGFIESSKDLEIYIKRYDKEIHNIMNVPNDLVFMNSYEQTHPYSSSYISNTNNNVCHCESNMISSTCQEPHAFSFPIDTGNLDFNENPGIQLLFKISNPDGYATLGNLEIIEERSLTEKEIQTVNEREQKWKQTKEKEQRETEQVYSQAQQAVQFLFKNNHMLQLETTMSDIVTADQLIDQIPYVYHEWFPHEPGINYTLYTDLKQQISQAYTLYQNRNFVQNGNFRYGTTNWNISPDATVQQIDNTSVLVIPNWSTQVSQQINLQSNQQYVVRVIAKKEGTGTGYITMSDCANHIQTLQFNTCGNINNTMCQSNLEYSTKTMYFTPHTNQVRIDIGETEGTFKISSIELLCVNS